MRWMSRGVWRSRNSLKKGTSTTRPFARKCWYRCTYCSGARKVRAVTNSPDLRLSHGETYRRVLFWKVRPKDSRMPPGMSSVHFSLNSSFSRPMERAMAMGSLV